MVLSMAEPVIIRDEVLCKGRRVTLYKRTIKYKDLVFDKDVVSFGQAVVVVPVLSDEKIVFIEQWRAPVKGWIIELPAGRVEKGENPDDAALRELEEEVGYRASEIDKIASAFMTPGYSDEFMHIYVARGLTYVGAKREVGEIIRTKIMSLEEYLNYIKDGGLGDMKTIAALLLYKSSLK